MAFQNVLLSEKFSYGSSGGPGFRTNEIPLSSGILHKVSRQPLAMRKWELNFGVKRHSLLAELRAFYMARTGTANSFRVKDFYDCISTGNGLDPSLGGIASGFEDENIGTGDGTTKVFQLKKRFTSGSETYTQNIYLPESGTVRVGIDSVEQVSGWSVNLTTGEVTFTVAPTLGESVDAGFSYHHKAFFSQDVDEFFRVTAESYGAGNITIPLVEDIADQSYVNEHNFGGSYSHIDVLSDLTISLFEGRAHKFTNVAGSLTCHMPKVDNLPGGGIFFVLYHADTSGNAIEISAHSSESQGLFYTLQPDERLHVFLDKDSGEWWAA